MKTPSPKQIAKLGDALKQGHEQTKGTAGVSIYKSNQANKEKTPFSNRLQRDHLDAPNWVYYSLNNAVDGKLSDTTAVMRLWIDALNQNCSKLGKDTSNYIFDEYHELLQFSDQDETIRNKDGLSAEDLHHIFTAVVVSQPNNRSTKFDDKGAHIEDELSKIDVYQLQTPYGVTLGQLLRGAKRSGLPKFGLSTTEKDTEPSEPVTDHQNFWGNPAFTPEENDERRALLNQYRDKFTHQFTHDRSQAVNRAVAAEEIFENSRKNDNRFTEIDCVEIYKEIFDTYRKNGIEYIKEVREHLDFLSKYPIFNEVALENNEITGDLLTQFIRICEQIDDPRQIDKIHDDDRYLLSVILHKQLYVLTHKRFGNDLFHYKLGSALSQINGTPLSLIEQEFKKIQNRKMKYYSVDVFRCLINHGIDVDVKKKLGIFGFNLFWPALREYRLQERVRKEINSEYIKQTGSKYMASTTLSDRAIENVIRRFLENKTIRQTARECGISNKAASQYHDLILERLYYVGYYKPKFFFENKLLLAQDSILNEIKKSVWRNMKRHRGLAGDDKIRMYEAKYYTRGFYYFFFQRAFSQEDTDKLVGQIMFNDVKALIRMTGQLNKPVYNIPRAEEYIKQGLNRRVTKSVIARIKKSSIRTKIVEGRIDNSDEIGEDILEYISKFVGGNLESDSGSNLKRDAAIHIIKSMLDLSGENATINVNQGMI